MCNVSQPDTTFEAIAARVLSEAIEIADRFGIDRALQKFDGELQCAVFWAVEDFRRAGHAELRRRHLERASAMTAFCPAGAAHVDAWQVN